MEDLSIALTSTALGAVLGFGAASLQSRLDRRRIRRSFASFLLSELRSAEVSLRVIYEHPIGAVAPNAFQSLRMGSEAINVFRPNTVVAMAEVEGYIAQIREVTDKFLRNETTNETYTQAIVRVFAKAAYDRIPSVKRALEKEGGRYEPFIAWDIPSDLQPGAPPPPLPPGAFPDAERHDALR
jgi:hypothetical protein